MEIYLNLKVKQYALDPIGTSMTLWRFKLWFVYPTGHQGFFRQTHPNTVFQRNNIGSLNASTKKREGANQMLTSRASMIWMLSYIS
jgi:hypothetical protein